MIFPPLFRFGFSESGVRRVAVWSFVCVFRALLSLLLFFFFFVFLFFCFPWLHMSEILLCGRKFLRITVLGSGIGLSLSLSLSLSVSAGAFFCGSVSFGFESCSFLCSWLYALASQFSEVCVLLSGYCEILSLRELRRFPCSVLSLIRSRVRLSWYNLGNSNALGVLPSLAASFFSWALAWCSILTWQGSAAAVASVRKLVFELSRSFGGKTMLELLCRSSSSARSCMLSCSCSWGNPQRAAGMRAPDLNQPHIPCRSSHLQVLFFFQSLLWTP